MIRSLPHLFGLSNLPSIMLEEKVIEYSIIFSLLHMSELLKFRIRGGFLNCFVNVFRFNKDSCFSSKTDQNKSS